MVSLSLDGTFIELCHNPQQEEECRGLFIEHLLLCDLAESYFIIYMKNKQHTGIIHECEREFVKLNRK